MATDTFRAVATLQPILARVAAPGIAPAPARAEARIRTRNGEARRRVHAGPGCDASWRGTSDSRTRVDF